MSIQSSIVRKLSTGLLSVRATVAVAMIDGRFVAVGRPAQGTQALGSLQRALLRLHQRDGQPEAPRPAGRHRARRRIEPVEVRVLGLGHRPRERGKVRGVASVLGEGVVVIAARAGGGAVGREARQHQAVWSAVQSEHLDHRRIGRLVSARGRAHRGRVARRGGGCGGARAMGCHPPARARRAY